MAWHFFLVCPKTVPGTALSKYSQNLICLQETCSFRRWFTWQLLVNTVMFIDFLLCLTTGGWFFISGLIQHKALITYKRSLHWQRNTMLNTRFDYHQLNFRMCCSCRENIAEDFFENIKLMFSASKMSWEAQRLWQTVALWAESSSAVLRFLNMALCWNGIHHRYNPIYSRLPKDGMRLSSHFQTRSYIVIILI